jgi:hypothetical protein
VTEKNGNYKGILEPNSVVFLIFIGLLPGHLQLGEKRKIVESGEKSRSCVCYFFGRA